MTDPTKIVLALDLANLTPEQSAWLHELKQKATVFQARLTLKHWDENYKKEVG